MNSYEHIILFDGVCNLCNGLVNFIIKRDPDLKFKFCPLQSPQGKLFLQKFNLNAEEINTLVYIKGEKCFQKSTAVLNVLKDIKGPWKIFYVFIIVPPFIRDFVYTVMARLRYKIFGKRERCMIPDDKVKKRFIE